MRGVNNAVMKRLCVLLSVVLGAGCVGDAPIVSVTDSGLPDASATDTGAADASLPSLSITPVAPFVRRGGSIDVTVNVDRQSLTGPITIVASGMPSGVTAAIGAIAGATGTLKIAAAAGADTGSAKLTLKAAGVADFSFDLLVAGAPGELDDSFDNDGIVLDTASATGTYLAVVAQADGKVVAVGSSNAPNGAWLVRRYNADGSLDVAFNTAAAAVVPTTGAGRSVVIDPVKARVVIGGTVRPAASDRGAIVRLNADGTVDQGFASAGTMLLDTVKFGTSSVVTAVSVLPDSSVLAVGTSGGTPSGFVTRYMPKGVLDGGFLTFTTPNKATLTAVMQLGGGSVLAVGTDTSTSPPAQLAVRLTSNGTPDALFNVNGTRTYASGCRGYGGALTSGGDALIVGQEVVGPSFCETRIAASGTGALVWSKVYEGGNAAGIQAATAAPGDGTYAVGHTSSGTDRNAFVAQRKADGNLEPSFATAGQALFEDSIVPDTYSFVFSGTTTADGRILVAGQRLGTTPGPLLLRIWQ